MFQDNSEFPRCGINESLRKQPTRFSTFCFCCNFPWLENWSTVFQDAWETLQLSTSGGLTDTSDDIYIYTLIHLHNNPSWNVLEYNTVAGFVGGLSSWSGSSHKLFLKLVLVQGRKVYQVLFTGCPNTQQPGWARCQQGRATGWAAP